MKSKKEEFTRTAMMATRRTDSTVTVAVNRYLVQRGGRWTMKALGRRLLLDSYCEAPEE